MTNSLVEILKMGGLEDNLKKLSDNFGMTASVDRLVFVSKAVRYTAYAGMGVVAFLLLKRAFFNPSTHVYSTRSIKTTEDENRTN